MACSHPVLAVYYGKREDGKKNVRIIKKSEAGSVEALMEKYNSHRSKLIMLPCGKCPGCLKTRRKQWAIRCENEAKYYADNCFITLTYDEEHYSVELEDGSKRLINPDDCKKDYQDFLKGLRNRDIKVRYYGCCERGSRSKRLHIHMILFGYTPSDLKASHKSDSGFWCYTSKFLSEIWKKGLVVVSEFVPEAAAYVAGYVDKKLTNPDDDSFTFMSTKPGIGRVYVEANLGKLYEYDNIVVRFGSHKSGLPRYFDKVAEQNGIVLDHIKEKRVAASEVQTAQKFREFGVLDYSDYFDRILKDEVAAMRSRKRGL